MSSTSSSTGPLGPLSIWIASDHAGFELKEQLKHYLAERFPQAEVHDGGPADDQRVDYPTTAWPAVQQVAQGLAQGRLVRGVLICGTGIGVSLVANRHPDIRAALAHNQFTAEMARRHNDAQILCLGARVIGRDLALSMVDLFLKTPFEEGRHAERLKLLQSLEVNDLPDQVVERGSSFDG